MQDLNPRAARRLLWLLACVALPLPYAAVERGVVPPAWLAVVGSLMLAAVVADGGAITAVFMRLYLSQALLGTLMCWVLAYALTAALERWTEPAVRRTCVLVLALALATLAARPTYRTPMVRDGQPTNLIGLFVPA